MNSHQCPVEKSLISIASTKVHTNLWQIPRLFKTKVEFLKDLGVSKNNKIWQKYMLQTVESIYSYKLSLR